MKYNNIVIVMIISSLCNMLLSINYLTTERLWRRVLLSPKWCIWFSYKYIGTKIIDQTSAKDPWEFNNKKPNLNYKQLQICIKFIILSFDSRLNKYLFNEDSNELRKFVIDKRLPSVSVMSWTNGRGCNPLGKVLQIQVSWVDSRY